MQINIKCEKSSSCVIGRTDEVSVLGVETSDPTTIETEEIAHPKSSFYLDNSSNYAQHLNEVQMPGIIAGPSSTRYPGSFEHNIFAGRGSTGQDPVKCEAQPSVGSIPINPATIQSHLQYRTYSQNANQR